MSTVKSNTLQLGQSLTASQNFCWYQPSSPDGTVRLGNGNAGSVTDLVTVNSSGNVGIGTSSPQAKLTVNGSISIPEKTSAVIGVDYATSSGNGGSLTVRAGDGSGAGNSSGNLFLAAGRGAASSSNGYIAFGVAQSDNSSGLNAEYMRLDSSGNLGLGVTPSGWYSNAKSLEFQGGSLWSSTTTNMLLMANAYLNASASYIYRVNGAASYYYQAAGAHSWSTAPSGTAGNALSWTQAMTLDASGNLLISKTSTSDASTPGWIFNGGSFGGFGSCVFTLSSANEVFTYNNTSTTGTPKVDFRTAGTSKGGISWNNTSTTYATTSDERLKDDFGVATDVFVIDNTVVHDFEWKADGSVDRGVFAQEAYLVKPSAITQGQSEELNEDGTPVHPWGVDYSKYVPDLIVYCQQLRAELNELKAKVK